MRLVSSQDETAASTILRTAAERKSARIVLITDRNVDTLHAHALYETLRQRAEGAHVHLLVLPGSGESLKTRQHKAWLEGEMLKLGCGRDTLVCAVGGGVVGDLAGFVAATFMRGVPLVQIPTTLLAMVDASIGGKTAIDVPFVTETGESVLAKNAVGAFHVADVVFIDTRGTFLRTLPLRQVRAAMAEIAKIAATSDAALFERLEARGAALLQHTDDRLTERAAAEVSEIALHAANLKAEIAASDLKEGGIRAVLNFGHSIGHAIESLSQREGLLHGEAVSIGMAWETELAVRRGALPSVQTRVVQLLRVLGLPTRVPRGLRSLQGARAVVSLMSVDKKNRQGQRHLVLPHSIGQVMRTETGEWTHAVTSAELLSVLSPRVRVTGGSRGQSHRVSGHVVTEHVVTDTVPVEVHVPGSKSVSNRVLLMAALGRGTCRLRGCLCSQDTQVMLQALARLGVRWRLLADEEEAACNMTIEVEGVDGRFPRVPESEVWCGNAGTATRFLLAAIALCSGPRGEECPRGQERPRGGAVTLRGVSRMHQRPQGPLIAALRSLGVRVTTLGQSDTCLPLRVTTLTEHVRADGVAIADGSVSSQFASALLMCAPHVSKDRPFRVSVPLGAVSLSYVRLTVSLMRRFGVTVTDSVTEGEHVFTVSPGGYENPEVVTVEADASTGTYALALGALLRPTRVHGVGGASRQGDAQFARFLRLLGATGVTVSADSVTVAPIDQTVIDQTLIDQTAMDKTVMDRTGVDQSDGTNDGDGFACETVRADDGTVVISADFEPMTDAFLTACVVAACALPSHVSVRLRGIANQRVKECDRIRVMAENLALFGIRVEYGDDFIQVQGSKALLERPRGGHVLVRCHDDHRVAMSFAVLALCAPGWHVELDDQHCVAKTFPAFFRMLRRCFDGRTEAPAPSVTVSPKSDRPRGQDHVVVIGMRAAGKSMVTRRCARFSRRRFVDLDACVARECGECCRRVIETRGWDAFRRLECAQLRRALAEETPSIIACGGGIVDWPESREVLQDCNGDVVFLDRHIEGIVRQLESSQEGGKQGGKTDHRADIGDTRQVYRRRLPWYLRLSQWHLHVPHRPTEWSTDRSDWSHVVQRLSDIVRNRQAYDRCRVFGTPHATFLSLTLPSYEERPACVDSADVVELRGDFLCSPSPLQVARQVCNLRRHLPPQTPLLFCMRSSSQGGRADPLSYVECTQAAVRAGADAVDVEVLELEDLSLRSLRQSVRADTLVVLSQHWTSAETSPQSAEELCRVARGMLRRWRQAAPSDQSVIDRSAKSDQSVSNRLVIKLVTTARGAACVHRAHAAATMLRESLRADPHVLTLLVLAMGEAGAASRVLNTESITPVTHESIEKAAPGQLTSKELCDRRKAALLAHPMALRTAPSLALYGHPIAQSPSPCLHSAMAAALWHGSTDQVTVHTESTREYVKYDTCDPAEALSHLSRHDLWGASVTVPLKETVLPLLDHVSDEARAIGAVNTLVRDTVTGRVSGHNTDYLGILLPLRQRLAALDLGDKLHALVIGAGGTARAAVYALQQLPCVAHLTVLNRTEERAQRLCRSLRVCSFSTVASLPNDAAAFDKFDVVVCTVPTQHRASLLHTADCAGLWHRLCRSHTVVFDVAYAGQRSSSDSGSDSGSVSGSGSGSGSEQSFALVTGDEMLRVQARWQHFLWTGRSLVFACPLPAATRT